jgi:alpha-beta hydrolase superfamily lysophospholipase
MKRLLVLLSALALTACAPMLVQQPAMPGAAFQGPRFEADGFISFDGARLGLTRWGPADGDPRAVVVALHGMNDYANAFHLAAPHWAQQGVATYAIDQRGFGRSPARGVWGGEDLMTQDLRTAVAVARARHPRARVVVVGESMGGAVAIASFSSDQPPAADALVLLSPAVWGWKNQPLPNKTLLWLAARFTGSKVYTPPRWLTDRVAPTDNRAELIAMGRDPLMVWGARSDTLYGLVGLMDQAWERIGEVKVPTLYLYGAHDEIIPKTAAFRAAARLGPSGRTAYYDKGWHLLTRDIQGPRVWDDILAFLGDPAAALPSAPPPIPAAVDPRTTASDGERPAPRAPTSARSGAP